MPEDAATAIQCALTTAPALNHTARPSGSPSHPANKISSRIAAKKSSSSGSPLQTRISQSSGRSQSLRRSKKPPAPKGSQAPHPAATSAQGSLTRTCDVHLCVEAGSHRFIPLDCSDLKTDIEFFEKIKSEYNKARKWYRLHFSTWTYDFCEFFLFKKHGIGLGARLRIGFPNAADLNYEFSPRPPEYLPPDGPISHDEFNFYYYYDLCPSYMSWKSLFATSYSTNTGHSTVSCTALTAVPKRTKKLDMEDGRSEHFHGLYAREARSAIRVVTYISLCNLPSVTFFFLWLYRWGHGSDLQGAAVPVNLSLSLTIGFLGWLYWTR